MLAACSNPFSQQSSDGVENPQSSKTSYVHSGSQAQTPASESPFARDEERLNNIKQEIKDHYQDQGFILMDSDIRLEEIEDSHLEELFDGTVLFHAFIGISTPTEEVAVAYDGLITYFLPYDFNLMLNGSDIEITEQNVLDIAFAFAKITDPASIPYLEMDSESIVITQEEAWPFFVHFQTYSALGGLVTDWKFWIDRWNNVQKIDETLVTKEVGEFVEPPFDYIKQSGSIGIVKVYIPQR